MSRFPLKMIHIVRLKVQRNHRVFLHLDQYYDQHTQYGPNQETLRKYRRCQQQLLKQELCHRLLFTSPVHHYLFGPLACHPWDRY